jgi:ssDNA-binding Zn-finger/Zn-ribbon topoisomerase 1
MSSLPAMENCTPSMFTRNSLPEVEMKQKEPLFSKDGKCPHCQSTFVMKTGGFGAEACSLPGSPDIKVLLYKCYTCNKEFYRVAE